MPMWIADYVMDTRGLHATQHGMYLMLLFHYWHAGSLPCEDDALAVIACCSKEEWHKHKPVVQKFFYDGWKHKRVEEELAQVVEISESRSASALQRWSKGDAQIEAKPMLPHTPHSTLHKVESESLSSVAVEKSNNGENSGPTSEADVQHEPEPMTPGWFLRKFKAFREGYPKGAGTFAWDAASGIFHKAVMAEPSNCEAIIAGARGYRADCDKQQRTGTKFVMEPARFIKERLFSDYATERAASLKYGDHGVSLETVEGWDRMLALERKRGEWPFPSFSKGDIPVAFVQEWERQNLKP